MIYLLFGNDKRASKKILDGFERRFRSEVPHAWEYVDIRDQKNTEGFFEKVSGASLFSGKQFAIILYPSILDESLESSLKELIDRWADDDSIIVFYEGESVGKNKLLDYIKKKAKTEEFSYKTGPDVSRFVAHEIKKSGVEVSHEQRAALEHLYNENPESFFSEFEKIVLGGSVQVRVSATSDRDLFVLGDMWGRRDRYKAFQLFQNLLDTGFEADAILRTLLWQVKMVCLAKKGATKDMKPFVAQKARGFADRFTEKELNAAYWALMTASDFRQKENLETRLLSFILR